MHPVALSRSRRLRLLVLLVASVLAFCASTASAVSFEVTELGGCVPDPISGSCLGQEVTVGLRIGSEPGENVAAIGASVYGYDESVADFVRGSAVRSIFHAFADPAVGALDGLPNLVGPSLTESEIGARGRRVLIIMASDFVGHRENPLDPGLNGVVGGGDAQIRVTFRILGVGQTVLTIDTRYNGDAVVYSDRSPNLGHSNTVQIVLRSDGLPYVVPEPGTGLLIGLGLAGLAAGSRSRGRRPSP